LRPRKSLHIYQWSLFWIKISYASSSFAFDD
jgi:hypothetical protein